MANGLTLLTPPAGEPVSLAEAKLWCRIDTDDDSQDSEILELIAAAREWAEARTGRQLVSAQFRLALPCFPSTSGSDGGSIRVPVTPLQSVTQVTYTDTAGATQTVSTSVYQVSVSRNVGLLMPAYGQIWPIARSQTLDAVLVDFWAGYGPSTETTTGFESGTRTVTPSSMNGIFAGSDLLIGEGLQRERVIVSSVTSTTFTATFAKGHPDPVAITPNIPRSVRLAIQMIVNCRWRYRGDEGPAEVERVEEAACRLLETAWDGEYR